MFIYPAPVDYLPVTVREVKSMSQMKCEDCETVFEDNEEDDAEGIGGLYA